MKRWSVVCTAIFLSIVADAMAGTQPNILLIMADDLGYADVGFNGAKDIVTPELDKLAADGTIFTSAYVGHCFCGPSRAALLTGRYPQATGSQFNLPSWEKNAYRDQGVILSETMLSRVLHDAGYVTGLMGKWHLGEEPQFHPNQRGFDDFWGFLGGGKNYFGPYQEQTGRVWSYKTYPEHNGVDVTDLTEKDYLTDVLTDQGIRFVNEADATETPFFLFMSYNAPHTMLEARPEDIARFAGCATDQRSIYAAMVYSLDRGIGRLVDELKKTGQYENTLIVFLSDNGGRTDQGADNTPLKGKKNTVNEGGYRVPMFMHWPGQMPAGQLFEYNVSSLDLYPTLTRLAHATVPADKELDGQDIWDEVLAGENPRKGQPIYSMRYDGASSDFGGRVDQWKIYRQGWNAWELYNLEEDIGETTDLSARYPERLRDMVQAAEKWSRTHADPLWFNTLDGGTQWKENDMPHYDQFFRVK